MKIFVETGSYDFGNVGDVAMLQPTFRTFQSIFEQFYNPYSVRVSTIFVF